MQEERVTLKQIEDMFDTILLLEDRNLIRLILAVVIGNQITTRRPIWLMLVAPSSSGKTTALNALLDLEITLKDGQKIRPTESVSDLTENTFISGMQRSDKETSLLMRIPRGGVLMFKDFTSILSKREETKKTIMSQLREVYDGSYKKSYGTGESVTWKGKIGAIAGVTEAIYQHLESMSVMGDRFMLYQIPQPNRKDTLRFKLQQEDNGTTEDVQMPKAQQLVHTYMQQAFDMIQDVRIVLDPKTRDEIIDVADFCTMVRSGVITNVFTNQIQFVPAAEMPSRMFEQMLAMASALILIKKVDNPDMEVTGKIDPGDFNLLYKLAYDSIPVVRRIALRYLAQYTNGVETGALATKTNYPTSVVGTWLEQLNALGIVTRVKRGGFGNWWKLKPEYRAIMLKLQGVNVIDEWMTNDGETEDEISKAWEAEKQREQGIDAELVQEMIDNDDW